MNFNKFYQLAELSGITKSQLIYKKSNNLSITVFRGEIENYSSTSSSRLLARGLYKGKSGSGTTENISSKSFEYLVDQIKSSASILETQEDSIFFEDEAKYTKKKVFSKNLDKWDSKDIQKKLFNLEGIIKTADSRVKDVRVSFEKETKETIFTTSKGLRLAHKGNSYLVVVVLYVEQEGIVKNDYEYILSINPLERDIRLMANKVLQITLSKFGKASIEDGKYKAVLSQSAVGSFLDVVLKALNSEETQKHSSFLEGKLNEQVFSSNLTVEELPLTENVFFSYFDDEGVPTQNKTLIEKGVIKTYLYNLVTAKKDGVSSTGNGSRSGSKIKIAFNNVFVKPGELDLDNLFDKTANGIYVTKVQGLRAGMNEKSGDFSLQAEGFIIKDGKLSAPLPLFTVSGNVFELFNNIIHVGCDGKLLFSKITTPSILVENLKISVS